MSAFNSFLPVSSPRDHTPFPDFAKPLEIGHFSSDAKNQLHWDKRQLSYYAPPKSIGSLNLDLNDGFEDFVEGRHRLPGCLDTFLKWIIEEKRRRCSKNSEEFSKTKFSLKELVHGVDFVCWRGLLTKLGATPYEEREGWLFGAVRFRDVIFLVGFETQQEKEKLAKMTEKEKRMTYWGHRFEKYVTKSKNATDGAIDHTDQPIVDCNAQYCAIFRTKISQSSNDPNSREYRLLYGAEIDCLDDRDRYVELKTSRVIDNWRQERNFKKFKLLKWWLQSFLVGIDRIICGYRNDSGIIKSLTPYDVDDMPRSAAGSVGEQPYWSGAVCMNFVLEFLSFVAKNTPSPEDTSCIGEIMVFEFLPQSRQVRIANNHGFTSDQVLPDWFVTAFGKT